MYTILIGDGLTKDILSPAPKYRDSKRQVGRQEIGRLMGRGKAYGEGPLPLFLREAAQARRSGKELGIILVNTRQDDPEEARTDAPESDGFVDPLVEVAQQARVVSASTDTVPRQALLDAVAEMVGVERRAIVAGEAAVRFLLVGCETEKRILLMATWLRNVLGYQQVGVAAHLVGSSTQEAHFATLRHNLPSAGVRVFLDLEQAASFAGLSPESFAPLGCRPCAIEPQEFREALSENQRRIIELLCMHWTRTEVRPLQGGFSGSLLLLADGWKGEARTEPAVLKIDSFSQMRRELDGYYQVKDFFGKHVPTFDFPVVLGDSIGVGMELAAMDGHPETLQDTFEQTDQEEALNCFLGRLDKALALLSERLYRNTCRTTPVVPYRAFWLHTDQQLQWLRENAGFAMSYHEEAQLAKNTGVNPVQIEKMLRVVAANEDTLESEVCLSHGDLNLANIICDQGDNTWFIDWTHCGENPVELDFAKLENDIKFAVSKEFEVEDLSRLKKFEEYLLAHRLPADANSLPEHLKFAKWDLRFRKVLAAVRRVREACFALKQDDDWLIYRTALLKYALHTLSFDKRRGRGECDLPQLMLALYSVEGLVFDLIADDFHLKIRAERPSVYPPRQRIAIDEAPWLFECPDYDPPYYVAPEVLENDRTRTAGGWAEPEDFAKTTPPEHDAKHKDDQGRPLNPRGRTGIAGRGLLGRWGPNLAVAAIVTRAGAEVGQLEILVGRKEGRSIFALPKGFVLPDETPEAAVHRVLTKEVGWAPATETCETVFDGYSYDPRQTDHAWVEMRACLLHQEQDAETIVPHPGGDFEEAAWHPLTAKVINNMASNQARLARKALVPLKDAGRLDAETAEILLAKTG